MTDSTISLGQKWYGDKKLWQDYDQVRPDYPSELLDKVFSFHDHHGGQYKVAADFGTGNGTLIPILVRSFDRVSASDLNASLIGQLSTQYKAQDNVDIHVARAEEAHDWLGAGSVDFCVAGEAIHWFDDAGSVWLRNCARLLKPGGTVAFMVYTGSFIILRNPEANKIWNDYSVQVLSKLPTKQLIQIIASLGLTISFDQEYYKDETRFHYTLPEPEGFELVARQKGYDLGEPSGIFEAKPTNITRTVSIDFFEAYIGTLGPVDVANDADWAAAKAAMIAACSMSHPTFTIGWNMAFAMASRR